MIDTLFIIFFFISLVAGQLGSFVLAPGVQVYLHDIALGFLVLVTFFQYKKEKKSARYSLGLPVLVFISVCVVSLVANALKYSLPDVVQGSLYLVRWGFYASLYWIVAKTSAQKKLWYLYGLFGVGTAISGLGLAQYIFFPSLKPLTSLGWDEHYQRVFSTVFDPNFAGLIAVLGSIIGWYFLSMALGKKQRISFFLAETVNLVALTLTVSRSSFLALGISLVLWIVIMRNTKLLIIPLFVFLIYLPVASSSLDVNRLTRVASTVSRVENWGESFALFTKAPILGQGFNMLRSVAKTTRPIDTDGILSRDAGGVDSSILFVLATTGIIGLVAYAWIWWEYIRFFVRVKNRAILALGVVSFAGVLVHSFFNHSLFYPWSMVWLWVLAGVFDTTV